jgi:hypothetical protein
MKRALFLILSLVLAIGLALPMAMPVAADPGPGIVGLWHFDEGSGSTAYDSSGNSYDGILTNMDTSTCWVDDQWGGKALSFDGTNDYVYVPHPIAVTTAITMEAWVKVSASISTDVDVICKWDGVATGAPIHFEIAPNLKVRMCLRYGPGLNDYIVNFYSTDALPADQWVHVAEVWDGTTATIYFDGVAKGSVSGSGTIYHNSSMKYWIGSLSTLGRYFKGLIDEVRIWDTATPSFNLTARPEEDFNPVGTDHTVTATVTINKVGGGITAAPGVLVDFAVTGANSDTGSDYTDKDGEAPFSYTGDYAGVDTINASLDYPFYQATPYSVTKYWLEPFVTGGGNIKEGKKVTYTVGGNVGLLDDTIVPVIIVGQFEIVDHTGKNAVAWHCHNEFSSLEFSGDSTGSPPAHWDTATFVGTFTSNKGGSQVIKVEIKDISEPGKGNDIIRVDFGNDGTWDIGTEAGVPISGGNFQVHDMEE